MSRSARSRRYRDRDANGDEPVSNAYSTRSWPWSSRREADHQVRTRTVRLHCVSSFRPCDGRGAGVGSRAFRVVKYAGDAWANELNPGNRADRDDADQQPVLDEVLT